MTDQKKPLDDQLDGDQHQKKPSPWPPSSPLNDSKITKDSLVFDATRRDRVLVVYRATFKEGLNPSVEWRERIRADLHRVLADRLGTERFRVRRERVEYPGPLRIEVDAELAVL